jgi:hypothetical protein
MPRSSLRDLFWLTLVVGVAVAWWVNSRQLHREIKRVEEQARGYRGAAAAYVDSEAAWVRADADASAMREEIASLKRRLDELASGSK